MSDDAKDGDELKALEAAALAAPPWGVIREDGSFREIPKRPLINAGKFSPPFEVTLPGGRVVTIVERPDG